MRPQLLAVYLKMDLSLARDELTLQERVVPFREKWRAGALRKIIREQFGRPIGVFQG